MLISILLPILFYYMLHKNKMSPFSQWLHLGLMVLSFVFTLVIGYVDVMEFLHECFGIGSGES